MLKELFAKIISSSRNSAKIDKSTASVSQSTEAELFTNIPECAIEFTVEKPVLFDIAVPEGRNKPFRKTGYLRRKRNSRERPTVVC